MQKSVVDHSSEVVLPKLCMKVYSAVLCFIGSSAWKLIYLVSHGLFKADPSYSNVHACMIRLLLRKHYVRMFNVCKVPTSF